MVSMKVLVASVVRLSAKTPRPLCRLTRTQRETRMTFEVDTRVADDSPEHPAAGDR